MLSRPCIRVSYVGGPAEDTQWAGVSLPRIAMLNQCGHPETVLFVYDYRGLRVGDTSGDEAIPLLENELGLDETQARVLMFYMTKGLAGWNYHRFK